MALAVFRLGTLVAAPVLALAAVADALAVRGEVLREEEDFIRVPRCDAEVSRLLKDLCSSTTSWRLVLKPKSLFSFKNDFEPRGNTEILGG